MPASAGNSRPIDPELLCSNSGVVVEGDVTAIDWENSLLPVRAGGSSMAATTRVYIEAVDVIKGTLTDDIVVVRLPGGITTNGTIQVWQGTPLFHVGDRVVIFGTEEGSPALVNLTAFSNGALFKRATATADWAEDVDKRRIASWSAGALPGLWVQVNTAPSDDDQDEDTGGGDPHDALEHVTEVSSSPYLTWSALTSAAASVCASISTHEQAAQTINHTGW